MKKIRGVSLHQPWATFIAIGVKPYETRSWRTDYRGPLAIHAAKNKASLPLLDESEFLQVCKERKGIEFPLGAFVCTCVLTDCIRAERVPPDAFGDYTAGRWAWRLEDIRILAVPIPAKGQQGFWDAGTIEDDGTCFSLNTNPAPTYYGAPLI